MKWLANLKFSPFFIKLFNWEYWPSYAFYLPLMPYFLIQALRYRHLFFFTAANPGLETGGSGLESKYATLKKLPIDLYPKTLLVPPKEDFSSVTNRIKNEGITYPLIAKPDVGLRGFLVKKINSEAELRTYLQSLPIAFIIQEYIQLKNEFGVFYWRFPDEVDGRVTSITLKEFLSITGDGKSTTRQLIGENPRAKLQLKRLEKSHENLLDLVPPDGHKVSLGIIGNHSKGTHFINGNHLINDEIHQTFDRISKKIDGFHYGRFDIKCDSLEELSKGINLKILELNGVCAEPTHIYDASKSSYFGAIREIKRHWRIIHRLSYANFQRGASYDDTAEMLASMLNLRRYTKEMNKKLAEINAHSLA